MEAARITERLGIKPRKETQGLIKTKREMLAAKTLEAQPRQKPARRQDPVACGPALDPPADR